jgi:hypothetical protein
MNVRLSNWAMRISDVEAQLLDYQRVLDEAVYNLYGITGAERDAGTTPTNRGWE